LPAIAGFTMIGLDVAALPLSFVAAANTTANPTDGVAGSANAQSPTRSER